MLVTHSGSTIENSGSFEWLEAATKRPAKSLGVQVPHGGEEVAPLRQPPTQPAREPARRPLRARLVREVTDHFEAEHADDPLAWRL